MINRSLTLAEGAEMDFLEFLRSRNYFEIAKGIPSSLASTTVVALSFKDGAVICCDSQATQLSTLNIFREPIKKIFIVDSHSVVGIAGFPSLAIEITRIFRASLSVEEKISGSLSCDGKANLLKRIVMNYFPLVLQTEGKLSVELIFVSFDESLQKARIFSCDPTALVLEHKEKRYCAIGGGAEHALNKLDLFLKGKENLNEKEALKLGWKALDFARARNASTGFPYFFFVVTKKGVREILAEELQEILEGEND